MYVRSLLAQASVAHSETSSGEDHNAVDLAVNFPIGSVTVQVKTSAQRQRPGRTISVGTTEAWRQKWAVSLAPVYLVHVQLEHEPPSDWMQHQTLKTDFHAHAYWLRVNHLSDKTAKIPTANRLTADTFDEWAKELEADYQGA